ncbi:Synaptonemal complex protein 2-like, partial [Armadillidium nasatum]
MTGHPSAHSETPRASVNQNMHQTPLKLCPKSLFENEQCGRDSTLKQSESQPNLQEEPGPSVMCSTSTQSGRDNEPKSQEKSKSMSDTVRVPLSKRQCSYKQENNNNNFKNPTTDGSA